MDYLTSRLAQEIIDELQETISHDIHITDHYGRVIASSKIREIGRLNLTAVNSLNTRNICRIWVQTDTQNTGASIPIVCNNTIIGALCLEGSLHEIDPIILLLKTSVELLIHQKAILDSNVQIRRLHEQFLREWIAYQGEYDKNFVDRGLDLHKDIRLPRVAVVLHDRTPLQDVDTPLADILERNDGYVTHMDGRHILLITDTPKLQEKLRRIQTQGISDKLGVSLPMCHANTAISQARRALLIGDLFFPNEALISYEKVRLIDATSAQPCTEEMRRVIRCLDAYGRSANLVETLFTYVYHNGNIQETIDALFIHRNSLNYRFQRIFEITGYHPEKLQELMFLYTALVCVRMEEAQKDN